MIKYKKFTVTGAANETTLDTAGITSLTDEKRKLISIIVSSQAQVGNNIVGFYEDDNVLEIPDYNVDTIESTGGANTQKSVAKITELPINLDLPVGKVFKAGIKCGATLKILYGAYKYEAEVLKK